jgi:hypothetical protein
MSRNLVNDFSMFEYHMFYVLDPFVTYLLNLPRNNNNNNTESNGSVMLEMHVPGKRALSSSAQNIVLLLSA